MRYFTLGQDSWIPYGVLLTGVNSIGGYYESKGGNLSMLDRVIVSFVHSSPVNFYPDILDRQIFMVKGAVKEVFDLFLPGLEYKHCCLLDNADNGHEQYYIPVLEVLDEKTGIEEKRPVFRVTSKEIIVIASLDFIEAVLRRKPTGVRIGNV